MNLALMILRTLAVSLVSIAPMLAVLYFQDHGTWPNRGIAAILALAAFNMVLLWKRGDFLA